MLTKLSVGSHRPLEIVHANLYVPVVNPLTVVFGSCTSVNVGVIGPPVTTLQVPMPFPVAGGLPSSVAVVTLHRNWSPPARASVGACSTLIVTSFEYKA